MKIKTGVDLRLSRYNMFTQPYVRGRLDKLQYHYLRYQGMNIRRSSKKIVQEKWGKTPMSLIFYKFDRMTHSVVVAPLLFPTQPWREKTIPQVVEEGGKITPKPGYADQYDPRYQRANPYLAPALAKNMTPARQKHVWAAARRKAGV